MKRIVCLGGGPAGLYAAILLRKALPVGTRRSIRAEPARRHFRLGRGLLRPDHGEFPRCRPRDARCDPGQLPPLGRYRHPFPRPALRERRPRLLRHQPQAAAATCCRSGPVSWACTSTSSTRSTDEPAFEDADLIIAADGVNSRTRTRHARRLRARGRRAQVPLHLARHDPEIRRLHLRLRADRARLVPDPRLPVQRASSRRSSWRRARKPGRAHGLDQVDTEQSIAFCEALFGRYLGRPSRCRATPITCAARRG